ncbi:DENN domain-containing protein 2D [Spea bombifrons]|uniref:DENN domain-containing protein 2D n=1 Tax=Spea bombifrons TaxID=233779 RepID=UPI002349B679|nr:DENN domain-containing protein 2D [Spea bombifrons]
MAQLPGIIRRSFRRKSSKDSNQEISNGAKAAHPHHAATDQRTAVLSGGQNFFEYLVVVSLKKTSAGGYAPQITYQFPKRESLLSFQREEEERLLKAIPVFCFPEGNNWTPLTEYTSETFSFVLTNVDSSRKFGYCRRLLPSGKGPRLPEVYCIISCLGCFGLFAKILDEVEKRRQIATAVIYPFMQGLREATFPEPGKTVKIKSFIPGSGTEMIELTRPLDSRLEHVDFKTLLQCLSAKKILHIFASVVLERRIIFVAKDLSVLSQCIHAVAALLYPFTWEHTFIPVLPPALIDTVCCPTPFIVGVQKQFIDLIWDLPMEEVLVVDLCDGKLLRTVGDEEELLPRKLEDHMITSLLGQQQVPQSSEELNKGISEMFMEFFIKVIGHYSSHFKTGKGGVRAFQEKSFLKAMPSKSIRRFLKLFVRTQMFSILIQAAEKTTEVQDGYFHRKIQEFHEHKKMNKK